MLQSPPNPNYETVLKQHQHLQNITINDMNRKTEYQFISYLMQVIIQKYNSKRWQDLENLAS